MSSAKNERERALCARVIRWRFKSKLSGEAQVGINILFKKKVFVFSSYIFSIYYFFFAFSLAGC